MPARRFVSTGKAIKPSDPYRDVVNDTEGTLSHWLDTVHVEPVSAIEWDNDPWFEEGPRFLPDALWYYIKQGRGEATVGDEKKVYRIKPGSLLLYPPRTVHITRLPGPGRVRIISVHFYASLVGRQDLLSLGTFPRHIPESPQGRLAEISERLIRLFAYKPPGWRSFMAAELLTGLMHIICHHGALFGTPGPQNRYQHFQRLRPAFSLIQQSLANPNISVSDMARTLCLSEVQFRKLFRQATGIGPARFLLKSRVELACLLLRTTDLPIKQVAKDTGFFDLPHFYRTFQRWAGSTPACYRESQFYR